MIRKFWILLLVASLAACGGKKEVDPPRLAAGFERAINATSDSPALNFRGDNQLQRSTFDATLPFGVGSGFVEKGIGDVIMNVAYARPKAEGAFLIENFEFLLGFEDEWTFISTGSVAAPQLIAIRNDPIIFTELMAEVQFVNASSNLPTAEFYLTDIDAALGVPDATVAAGQYTDLLTVDFFTDSRLRVREPGSDVVLWDSGRFIVPTGSRIQFILLDYFGPSGNGVTVLGAGPAVVAPFPNEDLPSQVRIGNFIDDVASVDVYVDAVSGSPDYAAASFATVGGYLEFAPGTYTVTVTVAGEPDQEVFQRTDVVLVPGGFRTLVFAGSTASIVQSVLYFDDRRPRATEAQLRLLHNAEGALNFDLYLLDPGQSIDAVEPTFSDLPFLTSIEIRVAGFSQDVVFANAGTKTIMAGPLATDFQLGGVYWLSLANDPNGGQQMVVADDFVP